MKFKNKKHREKRKDQSKYALIQFYPAKDHPTGTVLADGIRLSNKPGDQTPNFIGFMIFRDNTTNQYTNHPLIYYKGRRHLFYPEEVEEGEEK